MQSKDNSSAQNPVRRLVAVVAALIIVIAAFLGSLTGGGNAPVIPTAPPTLLIEPTVSDSVTPISIAQGYGARKGFWQVFFTAPTGSPDASTYSGGIDTQLAAAISRVQRTLDIAAFEFNNRVLTQAVLDARARGVTVRIVTDDEHGTNDTADLSLGQFKAAGIPIVDDGRPGSLMHNKFMILDGGVVWTGSWNYTVNDTYRNNNNALALRSRLVAEDYQTEFNEMFEAKLFGPRSPVNTPHVNFTQDGTPIQIYFASEDAVVPAIIATLNEAQRNIRFMAFSFTLDELGTILKSKAASGIEVQGIFETTGSETRFSELTPLFCAGLPVRQDGNPFVLHHKVFIVDDTTVIAGSFNFSAGARDGNDENMFIITDPDLSAQYTAEFNRRWAEAKVPDALTCS
jgi:phosphatidylserine/phosphatidylglycerophosphate/cardiolipin synthase-like enzyme